MTNVPQLQTVLHVQAQTETQQTIAIAYPPITKMDLETAYYATYPIVSAVIIQVVLNAMEPTEI